MPANVTIIAETMNERTAQYPGQIHNVSVVYNIYRIVLTDIAGFLCRP